VAEIGTGTGLFTRLRSGRGLAIAALEPVPEMRAQAEMLADVTSYEYVDRTTRARRLSSRLLSALACALAVCARPPPRAPRCLERHHVEVVDVPYVFSAWVGSLAG
jgi:hypothetical protein